MLLIDGVKYELWTPRNEDEFEGVVKEHTQEIFGEQSVYFDRKEKLRSLSGIGSIPDGYVVILGNSPRWHIVEIELSSHPLHEHIVSQVSKFINGIKNPSTQREVTGAMYGEITRDGFLRLKVEQAARSNELYKFLSDLVSKPPTLTIIIEKDTEGLREAISTLAHPEIKVVEFQTFKRVGAEAVHAYLFEPLFQIPTGMISIITPIQAPEPIIQDEKREKRVTIKHLLDANVLKVGQIIYRSYRGQRFEGKVLGNGSIELAHTGEKFDSLSSAAKPIAGSVDGWTWWSTTKANGEECLLDELRKEFRENHPPDYLFPRQGKEI